MTAKEKRDLIFLLNKYQNELLKKIDSQRWNHGIKAQYNHARILANKLSTESANELIPYCNYDVECKTWEEIESDS